MKKKLLYRMNLALGAASVLLAGCHTKKVVPIQPQPIEYNQPADTVDTDTPDPAPTPYPGPVITKYGVPAPVVLVQ